MCSLS